MFTDIPEPSIADKVRDWTRKKIWPNEDDAAQAIFENSKNKEEVILHKYNITPYVWARRLATGVTIGTLIITSYINRAKIAEHVMEGVYKSHYGLDANFDYSNNTPFEFTKNNK